MVSAVHDSERLAAHAIFAAIARASDIPGTLVPATAASTAIASETSKTSATHSTVLCPCSLEIRSGVTHRR